MKIHKTIIKTNEELFKFINSNNYEIIEIKPIKRYKALFHKYNVITGYCVKYQKMI